MATYFGLLGVLTPQRVSVYCTPTVIINPRLFNPPEKLLPGDLFINFPNQICLLFAYYQFSRLWAWINPPCYTFYLLIYLTLFHALG